MKQKQVTYNCETKEIKIEEVEIEEIMEENLVSQQLTLEERVAELEKINKEQNILLQKMFSLLSLTDLYVLKKGDV